MRCGWSNSNLVGGLVQDLTSAATWVAAAIRRAQQRPAASCSVPATPGHHHDAKPATGSMVITELSVTNDHRTEYVLLIQASMREVILIALGNVGPPPEAPGVAADHGGADL